MLLIQFLYAFKYKTYIIELCRNIANVNNNRVSSIHEDLALNEIGIFVGAPKPSSDNKIIDEDKFGGVYIGDETADRDDNLHTANM